MSENINLFFYRPQGNSNKLTANQIVENKGLSATSFQPLALYWH